MYVGKGCAGQAGLPIELRSSSPGAGKIGGYVIGLTWNNEARNLRD